MKVEARAQLKEFLLESNYSKSEIIDTLFEYLSDDDIQELTEEYLEETDEEILERKAEEQYEYSKDETILEYLESLDPRDS